MSYQYCFCPACGVRRAACDYRCSICGGLVRRTPVSLRTASTPAELLRWRPIVLTEATLRKRPLPAAWKSHSGIWFRRPQTRSS